MSQTLDPQQQTAPVAPPPEGMLLSSRQLDPTDHVIKLAGEIEIGGKEIVLMAGPCAVEHVDQLVLAAETVRKGGARILRGGAYKPRSSPYAFQGLGRRGLLMLRSTADRLGMAMVTEVVAPEDVPLVADYADILQIGARNMANYRLLEEAGRSMRPVLLKRGLGSTIDELLLAAEYVLAQGNPDVLLCERGIRTFENATRFTLDIGAVPILKLRTRLPVVLDPSHAAGASELVGPLARAGIAAGADALLVEVHPNPREALCDGAQSLGPRQFERLAKEAARVAAAVDRTL